MKKLLLILTLIVLSQFSPALADPDNHAKDNGRDRSSSTVPARNNSQGNRSFQAPARQPVVINISRPSQRANNDHFQPAQKVGGTPSTYGRIQWPAQTQPAPRTSPASSRAQWGVGVQNTQQARSSQPGYHFVPTTHSYVQWPNPSQYASPGLKASNVTHHHPYTAGYVRKKLQKIGVTKEPDYITDRSQIMNTDKDHSRFQQPREGWDHRPLSATAISPRHFSDPSVRGQMGRVTAPGVLARINNYNLSETRVNHYYWHQENGFNYCHYIDNWGYHWYGWYLGDQYFWTRYYSDRWWWYDSDYGRWCFWNAGYWWWQDPYHVGDLYCYDNDAYIPTNSANDQLVVTSPEDAQFQVYNAPDGSCQVKVIPGSEDAFLYDTDDPNAIHPVYLASGVETVSFSDTSSGRPLEVVLKLSDGTFDMFDDDGNAYGPGNYDADQAAQGEDNPPPPPDDGTAPDPDGSAQPQDQ